MKHRPLSYFRKIWMLLLLSFPVDLILIPFALRLPFPDLTGERISLLIIGAFLLVLPLFKEALLRTALSFNSARWAAKSLSERFNSLTTAVFSFFILVDIARRVSTFGYLSAGLVLMVGFFLFPTWYRLVIRNHRSPQQAPTRNTSLEDRIRRSRRWFDTAIIGILILSRLGAMLCITVLSLLGASSSLTYLVLGCGLAIFSAARPQSTDFYRICRRCGLWGHRTLQQEEFCTNCAELAAKRPRPPRSPSLQERIGHALHRVERHLEQAKTPGSELLRKRLPKFWSRS
ncbi:hypothetical protein MRY87_09575 [bacterium]|nr:hypothetical protein [bacterium]